MPIDRISTNIPNRNITQGRVNEATSGKKENVQSSAVHENNIKNARLEDKIMFSQDAQKLQQIEVILQTALQKLNEMDEIHRDNLHLIQDKIDTGFYDQQEVKEKIISEIFPEEDLRKKIEVRMKAESYVPNLKKIESEQNIDIDRKEEIKKKIEDGYYYSKEVTENVSNGIISLLDI